MGLYARVKTVVNYLASGATDVLFSSQLPAEVLPRVTMLADGTIATSDPVGTVTNVTFVTTTVTVTVANNNYQTGDIVNVSGVVGLTLINGVRTVTGNTTNTFTFTTTGTPSGAYSSGGQVQRTWGGNGLANEGVWNLILNSASKVGLSLRSQQGATAPSLLAVDYLNNLQLSLLPGGGLDIGDAATLPSGVQTGIVHYSNHGRPYAINSAGAIDEINHTTIRRPLGVYKDVGLTSVTTVGGPAVVLTGTPSNSDNILAGRALVSLTSAASSNSPFGVTPNGGTYTETYLAWAPMFWARLRLDPSAITSVRYWIGLFASDPATVSTPGSVQLAGFRFDTGASDTVFQCITSDGSSATTTASTVTPATATNYDFRVETNYNNSSVRFLINDVVQATIATTLPASTTPLGRAVRGNTLTSSARALQFSRSVLSHVG